MKNIVILTGAGISAESGIPTFRASDGLWAGHHVEDVATPEGFARNPALVQEFYNTRRAQLKDITPNAAHFALAELSEKHDGKVFIITQNVDDLHERAGGKYKLHHMHGELKKVRCLLSDEIFHWEEPIEPDTTCPCCKRTGTLRPHIVWFGEMPLEMELIDYMLSECDLFISIGTSGNVYPAAGFVQQVRLLGKAHTVELNAEPSLTNTLFHEKIYGKATVVVPQFVKHFLSSP
jgi:NAD-dependent deacetylase